MLSQFIDTHAESPRAKLFWAVIAVVALAQLAALYMLCTQQVRAAQTRESALQMQRTAVNDCLQYMANSTIGSCARQTVAASADRAIDGGSDMAARNDGGMIAVRAQMTSAVPVNFSYR